MKKIVLIMTLVLAVMIIACSNKEKDDTTTENVLGNAEPKETYGGDTKKPEASIAPEISDPEDTLAPDVEGTMSPDLEDTSAPDAEGTMSPDIEDTSAPDGEGTMSPDIENTPAPEETPAPESMETENGNSNMDKYEYVVAYQIEGTQNVTDYDRCRVALQERIEIMELEDIKVWVENEKIYIGYDNKEYGDEIELITKKGEIHFRYNNEYLVFDNKVIKNITKKVDYKGEEYLIFELFGGYSEEFAVFTQEHIGGELVLRCDGEDVMSITIDVAVENGMFSVKKVPDAQVLDMLSVYIQSGTILELNPTAI